MPEPSIDQLVAELAREYTGTLPEEALREAQRRREEITPHLVQLIQKAMETVRDGENPRGDGHLFALFLLTEFQAKEAIPTILQALSLPDEGPFNLFGDAITEDLSGSLAALAGDSPEVLDELIANPSLNQYVRWEAAQTYLHLVRDGRLTRNEAVERLRRHLQTAIAKRDAEVASGLVSELVSYAPHEALDDIKNAYCLGIVDTGIVGLKTVEESIAGGESRFQTELEYCRETGVQDTVEELRHWASFEPPSSPGRGLTEMAVVSTDLDDWDDDLEPDSTWEPPTTVRQTGPRIGRNDPCPCGSGTKYKKCCGAA